MHVALIKDEFSAPFKIIFRHGSELRLLILKLLSVCATFMLEIYNFTVKLFSFLAETAQVAKARICSGAIGIMKFTLKILQNFLYKFNAELCFAHVCLLTEHIQ